VSGDRRPAQGHAAKTDRDMSAVEHFLTDYGVVPLRTPVSHDERPDRKPPDRDHPVRRPTGTGWP
jgi:hypothetical protein